MDGVHLEYFASDGTDDFPAADAGPQGHGQGTEEFDQVRYFQAVNETARYQCQGDDTHGFLGVIGAVGKGHEGCRYDLQPVGSQVDFGRLEGMTDGKDDLHDDEARNDGRDG